MLSNFIYSFVLLSLAMVGSAAQAEITLSCKMLVKVDGKPSKGVDFYTAPEALSLRGGDYVYRNTELHPKLDAICEKKLMESIQEVCSKSPRTAKGAFQISYAQGKPVYEVAGVKGENYATGVRSAKPFGCLDPSAQIFRSYAETTGKKTGSGLDILKWSGQEYTVAINKGAGDGSVDSGGYQCVTRLNHKQPNFPKRDLDVTRVTSSGTFTDADALPVKCFESLKASKYFAKFCKKAVKRRKNDETRSCKDRDTYPSDEERRECLSWIPEELEEWANQNREFTTSVLIDDGSSVFSLPIEHEGVSCNDYLK